jgi:hypothetical protein
LLYLAISLHFYGFLVNSYRLVTAFCSVQTELLIQAQLTRESAALPPSLQGDLRRVLELAPRLLEELMKVITASFTFFKQTSIIIANCVYQCEVSACKHVLLFLNN